MTCTDPSHTESHILQVALQNDSRSRAQNSVLGGGVVQDLTCWGRENPTHHDEDDEDDEHGVSLRIRVGGRDLLNNDPPAGFR